MSLGVPTVACTSGLPATHIVMITVMGGMRTFWGPLVGAVLFVMLQDYVSSMTTN